MQDFLHKCLTLVRSTGIEPDCNSLNPLIYKALFEQAPNRHQIKNFFIIMQKI